MKTFMPVCFGMTHLCDDLMNVRAILLDIEGTTTPIAFVHEVLFSYARTHARDFLARTSTQQK